ncbi:unnamed protein product (macronuclear) [Paramecium tetraurelia]|uniref:Uncharacterized protein n=1 Tax=Paramecium tetraurelia TaxID=5888 RepID=A0CG84_PARTE|nr:uncharacterized protein GSPATT00038246001 [Paramecium tetraurelia]CAK69801.1 unnamed protein product [Paramecium tetraurelia]|eukprot:XP_001437198.1 hypothetical protein (macronuclear) [Paramecium tetraurelia strain d4-2]
MKININTLFKEMGSQIKLLGSKIVGSSQALKELLIPITEESKSLKQSFNDYVKQIDARRKDQDDQNKRLEELRSKISSLSKSTYSNEKQTTTQLKQLKQQEKMMDDEYKMKQQQFWICKRDLGNFILEESQMIDYKINHTQTKCYEIIYFSLEQFQSKFNQTSQLRQLLEGSLMSQNRSQQRSATESRSNNNTQFPSQNQRSISPSNQISKQELQKANRNNNKEILVPKGMQNQNQKVNYDSHQIDNQVILKQIKNIQNSKLESGINCKQKSKSFLQFTDQLIESQDCYEHLKDKGTQQHRLSNPNKENQHIALSSLMNRKQSGASLKRSENSNASIFNCKGLGYLSNQESLDELFKKE